MVFILEKELSDILKKTYYKWKKKDITLQEVHELYFSAKDKYLTVQEKEEITKEASELILKILFLTGRITEEFIEKWQSEQLKPTDKELELLKEGCSEVLEAFDNHFKKELLSYYDKKGKQFFTQQTRVKQKVQKIKKLVQQEKSR